jgi:hypothetical protein
MAIRLHLSPINSAKLLTHRTHAEITAIGMIAAVAIAKSGTSRQTNGRTIVNQLVKASNACPVVFPIKYLAPQDFLHELRPSELVEVACYMCSKTPRANE